MTFGRFEEAHVHLQRALDLFDEVGDLSGHANARVDLARLLEFEGRRPRRLPSPQCALTLTETAGNASPARPPR